MKKRLTALEKRVNALEQQRKVEINVTAPVAQGGLDVDVEKVIEQINQPIFSAQKLSQ